MSWHFSLAPLRLLANLRSQIDHFDIVERIPFGIRKRRPSEWQCDCSRFACHSHCSRCTCCKYCCYCSISRSPLTHALRSQPAGGDHRWLFIFFTKELVLQEDDISILIAQSLFHLDCLVLVIATAIFSPFSIREMLFSPHCHLRQARILQPRIHHMGKALIFGSKISIGR